MLKRLLTRLETVHVAATQTEREAVYRLRYDAFIGELNRSLPGVDHGRKWMMTEDDELPGTTILYTGTPPFITSTIRLRLWGPGAVPANVARLFSMERFPGIERLTTSDMGRLAIRPDARGMLILPALVRASYDHLAGAGKADLTFCYCIPGLVRSYRMLGMTPYGGALVDTGSGPIQIPLVCVLSDAAALKRSGSILAPFVKKYFGPGKRPALDTQPFAHLLEADKIPIESNPAKVWREIEQSLTREDAGSAFFGLSQAVMKKLSRFGAILTFEQGQLAMREGSKEHEVYIVLDGTFEVFNSEKQIAVLGKGDLIGEIAFFTQQGRGERTASVRALTDGRLMVLRRKFLKDLTHSDPEAGYQILMNMGRIMAERLMRADATQAPPSP